MPRRRPGPSLGPVNRIRTETHLPFPPGRVWAVLADFDSYAEWNPLNIRASGKAALWARIAMTFVNPAKPGATVKQTVTITRCEPGRALAWRGYVPLLFDGVHFFELEAEAGGTRLRHGEDQSGLIPWTYRHIVESKFVPAYEAFNRALEVRLRQLAS